MAKKVKGSSSYWNKKTIAAHGPEISNSNGVSVRRDANGNEYSFKNGKVVGYRYNPPSKGGKNGGGSGGH